MCEKRGIVSIEARSRVKGGKRVLRNDRWSLANVWEIEIPSVLGCELCGPGSVSRTAVKREEALGQAVVEDLAVYIGQTALNTIVVKGKVFMIDSEQVQDGGMEIIPGNRVFSYFPANVIGSTV